MLCKYILFEFNATIVKMDGLERLPLNFKMESEFNSILYSKRVITYSDIIGNRKVKSVNATNARRTYTDSKLSPK